MKKQHILFSLFQFGFVVIVLLSAGLLPQAVWAVDCSSDAVVPISGDMTITTNCQFPDTVDGVDNGTGTAPNTAVLTISSSATLTVGATKTLVVGSIDRANGGPIVIIAGGQIKPGTPLWMTDADNDGYPASSTQIAQATTPTGGKRRNAFSLFAMKSNRAYDYNDNDPSVYPGTACNGVCSVVNTDGTCGAKSAGKYGLATCTACNGVSLSAVNIAAASDTYDDCTASYNACSGNDKIGPSGNCDGAGACQTTGNTPVTCSTASTCQTGGGCSAGSCTTVTNVAVGTDPNNQCTASLNACSGNTPIGPSGNCDGAGACQTTGNTGAACTGGYTENGCATYWNTGTRTCSYGCSAGSCVASCGGWTTTQVCTESANYGCNCGGTACDMTRGNKGPYCQGGSCGGYSEATWCQYWPIAGTGGTQCCNQ